MEIYSFDTLPSTQLYLKDAIKQNKLKAPCAITCKAQTNGIGSKDNAWIGLSGNLFLSFAIPVSLLPKDLPLASSSIYFAYILKDVLSGFGSRVVLKWPNDFYVDGKKIGGMVTNLVDEVLIVGVGLNTKKSPDNFGMLDIDISQDMILKQYFKNIEKFYSWKQIFSKYKLEFDENQDFFINIDENKVPLHKTVLQNDGSLMFDGKRIYSRR